MFTWSVQLMVKYNLQNAVSCVKCYNYSTWKLLAWWLCIQCGLSCRSNRCVGVSCMRVWWETSKHVGVITIYNTYIYIYSIYICLLLSLALQPPMGFTLLSDSLPFFSFLTLFSPPFYSYYLHIFFNIYDPFLLWSSSNSRTYRLPL